MAVESKNITELNRETASFFDSVASRPGWGRFNTDEEEKASAFFELLNVKSGDLVLEAGCGAGRFTGKLSEAVSPGGWVLAVDISSEMISRAKRISAGGCITYKKGDVHRLPVAPEEMNIAVCYNSFGHFCAPLNVLLEFNRVLKRGGRLGIAYDQSRDELNLEHESVTRGIYYRLPSVPEMVLLLKTAGFKTENVKEGFDRYFVMARKVSPPCFHPLVMGDKSIPDMY